MSMFLINIRKANKSTSIKKCKIRKVNAILKCHDTNDLSLSKLATEVIIMSHYISCYMTNKITIHCTLCMSHYKITGDFSQLNIILCVHLINVIKDNMSCTPKKVD